MPLLSYIAIAANILAFLQMAIDKRLAERGKRRISETRLIMPVLFGGIIGLLAGMLAFRHKTKKRSFQMKLLLALVIFLAAVYSFANR